jgi:signal transduction histidine kinase/CheY-like chemotaxis protein
MISEALASEIFPFSIYLDDNICLRGLGRTLGKHVEFVPGTPFGDLFNVVRWPDQFTKRSLEANCGRQLTISTDQYKMRLFGSFVALESGFLFLGGPRVKRLEELSQLGLSISDFEPHDGVMNYLFLLQELRVANKRVVANTRELATQHQRLQQILDQSQNLIFGFHSDGTISLQSAATERLLSITPGKTRLHDLVQGDGVQLLEGAIERLLSTGTPESLDLLVLARAGDIRTLRGTLVLTTDDTGEEDLHGFFVDVTDELRAEEELRETNEQLQRNQQMEALGRLSSAIAHDFNNVLAVIMGAASLASESTNKDEQIHAELDMVLKSATQGAALVKQLLAFSRRGGQQGGATEIVGRMQELIPIMRLVLGGQVTVNLKTQLKSAWIAMDPARFEQVAVNLAFNARDAMPAGGAVTIEILDSERTDWVRFAFSDTGVGMDETTRRRVFEPFYSKKTVGTGTGLGLSIIYGAVADVEGRIDIRSKVGRGTSVLIDLPLRQGPVEEEREFAEQQSLTAPTITAVVEDEPGILSVVKRIVEGMGSKVICFGDLSTARADLINSSEKLDLLITDVALGDGNGLDLASELVELGVVSRVLVMTGYADRQRLNQVRPQDGWEVLMKPFNIDQLREAVSSLMARGRAEPNSGP